MNGWLSEPEREFNRNNTFPLEMFKYANTPAFSPKLNALRSGFVVSKIFFNVPSCFSND